MSNNNAADITRNEFHELLQAANRALTTYRFEEAVKLLKKIITHHPAAEIYAALALAQKNTGETEAAKLNYENAIKANPDLLEANYNYGIMLYEQGDAENAIIYFRKACGIKPDFAEAWYNLGNGCRTTGKYDEALKSYAKAIELKSGFEDAVYNIGVVYFNMFEYGKALEYYDRAIEMNNANNDAHWNKALLLLAGGDYKNGWEEYESRLQREEFKRDIPLPVWRGEDLNGKSILVYGEQGFGDNVQFVRFVKMLKEKGAHVAYEARKELMHLFGQLEFIDEVLERYTKDYEKPEYDYCIPVMSLPERLNIELNDLPYMKNYIAPDTGMVTKWSEVLPGNDICKIGICWAGNREHQNDEKRSIPFELFITMFHNVEDIELYNLQLGLDENDKAEITDANVNDLTDLIDDFTDTAALIAHLDIVITVDTAIAHLAGAMGKPAWVLLPANSDWRWLRERKDSPWYPSVKLFRTDKNETWNDVLIRVNKELQSNKSFDLYDKEYKAIASLINNNKFEEALLKLTKVLTEDPAPHRAFNLMGTLYSCVGNHVKAIEYYSKAVTLKEDFPEALSNMGSALAELNQLEYSLQYHQKALALNPDNVESRYNLAVAYERLAQYDNALEHYGKVLSINPEHAKANFNRALIYLLQGRYDEGWQGYEKWGEPAGTRQQRDVQKPKWDGSPFEGKTLYVYPDQGLGDTIQFIRYLPLVKELGGKVILECQSQLYPILTGIPGVDEFVKTSNDLSFQAEHDLQIPVVSLPAIFNKVIEQEEAYIKADEKLSGEWREQLKGNFKAGLVWKGNPVHTNDRNRSMELQNLEPLFALNGVDYYLLQKEPLSDEEINIVNKYGSVNYIGGKLTDFTVTAAVIDNLDLVITVDTSVAHLAGAMCRDTWLMLPLVPDWRWLLERTDTPWYETMKLYRQHVRMDWESVVSNIKKDLEERIKQNS